MEDQAMMAILGAGNDPQVEVLKRQQALIDKLRAQSMAGAPTQMAGRVALRNTGQVLQNMGSQFQANQMQPGVDQGMADATGRTNKARKDYLDALQAAMRRNVPPQPQSMLPEIMEGQ